MTPEDELGARVTVTGADGVERLVLGTVGEVDTACPVCGIEMYRYMDVTGDDLVEWWECTEHGEPGATDGR